MIAHMFQRSKREYTQQKNAQFALRIVRFFVESSHFHNNGKNHWAAMRFLVEKFAQRMLDFVLDE